MPLLRTILPWQVQEDDLEERRRQERENLFARLDSIHAEYTRSTVPEPAIDLDLPADSVVPQEQVDRLGPAEEEQFQRWYSDKAQQYDLNPNPDDPRHFYDYRAAFRAGADAEVSPQDRLPHWPSEFKLEGHPNLIVDGVDTRTGRPAAVPETSLRLLYLKPSPGSGVDSLSGAESLAFLS